MQSTHHRAVMAGLLFVIGGHVLLTHAPDEPVANQAAGNEPTPNPPAVHNSAVATAPADVGSPIRERALYTEVVLQLPDHGTEILAGRFSRDGLRVATIDRNARLRILDAQTGRLILERAVGPPFPFSGEPYAEFDFSPDGSQLALILPEVGRYRVTEIQIVDIPTGDVVKRLRAPPDDPQSTSTTLGQPRFTSSGERLVALARPSIFVVGEKPNPGRICCWKLADEKLERTFPVAGDCRSFALLPDSVVACAPADSEPEPDVADPKAPFDPDAETDHFMQFVDLNSGRVIRRFSGPRHRSLTHLAATPDGTTLVAAADYHSLAVYDVKSATKRFQVEKGNAYGYSLASNGLLARHWERQASFYVVGEKKLHEARTSADHHAGADDQFLDLSPDGTRILAVLRADPAINSPFAGSGMTIAPDGTRTKTARWPVIQAVHWSQQERLVAAWPDFICGAAVSPDGRRLAWADRSSLTLCSLADGKITATVPIENISGRSLRPVEFCPDGRHLAVSAEPFSRDRWQLFSIPRLELVRSRAGPLNAAPFSPDGKSVFYLHYENPAVVQEVAGTAPPTRLDITAIHAQFAGPHSWLFTAGQAGIAIYDRSGKKLKSWDPGRVVDDLAVSSDAKLVATSHWEARRILVWDADTTRLVCEINNQPAFEPGSFSSEGRCAVFSPDGRWILSATSDSQLKIWSATTGKLRAAFPADQPMIQGILPIPGTTRFLTYGESQGGYVRSRISEWDLAHLLRYYPEPTPASAAPAPPTQFTTGHSPHRVNGHGAMTGFLDGGRTVYAYFAYERKVTVRDFAADRVVAEYPVGNAESAAMSTDGRWLAASYAAPPPAAPPVARSAPTPHIGPGPAPKNQPPKAQPQKAEPPKYAPGHVKIWDTRSDLPPRTITLDTAKPIGLSFSPDGGTLAVTSGNSAYADDSVQMLEDDLLRDHLKSQINPPADEDLIAELSLWDVASATRVETVPALAGGVRMARFGPHGDVLAFCNYFGRLSVWDRRAGKVRFGVDLGSQVFDVQFSPDGRMLAVCSGARGRGMLTLLDAATGEKRAGPTVDPSDYLLSAAFSPDGKSLAAAYVVDSQSYGLRFWWLPDLKEFHRVTGRPYEFQRCRFVRFSPDSRTLLDGDPLSSCLWNLDDLFEEAWQREIRAAMAAGLTVDYLPDSVRFRFIGPTDGDLAKLPEFTRPFRLEIERSGALSDAGMDLLSRQKNLVGLKLALKSITPAGLAALRNLPLRYLDLSGEPIVDGRKIAVLEQFPQLETLLRLSVNSDSNTVLASLSRLRNLRELDLEHIRVPGAAFKVMDFPKLEVLRLRFARIADDDFRYFGPLPKLKVLQVRSEGNGFTGSGLKYLAASADLEELHFWDCNYLTDAGLAALPEQKKLRKVDLSYTGVTGAGYAKLVSSAGTLEEIEVPREITDEALVHLGKLTKLRGLNLNECPHVTAAGIEKLAGLKDLKYLRLPPQTTDEALDVVRPMTRLTHLSVENAELSEAGIAKLADLPNLESLNLDGTNLSDAALPHLAKLKNLTSLSLRKTGLTTERVQLLRKQRGEKRCSVQGP